MNDFTTGIDQTRMGLEVGVNQCVTFGIRFRVISDGANGIFLCIRDISHIHPQTDDSDSNEIDAKRCIHCDQDSKRLFQVDFFF